MRLLILLRGQKEVRVATICLINESVCGNIACQPNGSRIGFGATSMEEQKGLAGLGVGRVRRGNRFRTRGIDIRLNALYLPIKRKSETNS